MENTQKIFERTQLRISDIQFSPHHNKTGGGLKLSPF